MNIDETLEWSYGDEYPKPIFARYAPNFIQVKRTRKRAIERARRKTQAATIEVGDAVKVISLVYTKQYFGETKEMNRVGDTFIVGEIGYEYGRDEVIDYQPPCYSYHRNDLKLVKKGSN